MEENRQEKGKLLPELKAFFRTLAGKRLIALAVVIVVCVFLAGRCSVSYDGYYLSPEEDRIYYRSGEQWYAADSDGWHAAESFPMVDYTNYSLGADWSEEWGVSEFRAPEN